MMRIRFTERKPWNERGRRTVIRIAIVEDEELYISKLEQYLKQYQEEMGEQFELTVYRDGDEITSGYKAQFDIILMDIQMKFMDGMSAAEEIRRQDSQVIIFFITNMTQYAIRGYEVDALDYILKPVTYFIFSQKLNKAVERIKSRKTCFVTIPLKGGFRKMDVNEIYYVESQSHTLNYHTQREIFTCRGNMKETENLLAPRGFFRINKGYLVNMKYVDTILEGNCRINGESLPVARARRKLFMDALAAYISEVMK